MYEISVTDLFPFALKLSDYNTWSSDYQVQFTFKLPHTDSPLTDSFPSCQCSCIVNACTDLQEMLGSHRPKINGIINSNAYLKRWFNFPQREKTIKPSSANSKFRTQGEIKTLIN